jgi:hypothetical protein
MIVYLNLIFRKGQWIILNINKHIMVKHQDPGNSAVLIFKK